MLDETFSAPERTTRWAVGVLATPRETLDSTMTVEQKLGALSVTPSPNRSGNHFSGYVSTDSFDLNQNSVTVQVRRAASNATTIIAVGINADNWLGFRIEDGVLHLESHNGGKVARRSTPYNASNHKYFRVRTSSVAPVAVWETSPDGSTWNPEYVETLGIPVTMIYVAVSAGTTKPIASTSAAMFDAVIVELRR